MANEPERPIEALLRAAAKKRRDEAGLPLDLHPATRRLLQSEVARKHAGELHESGSLLQGFRQLWPRLVWGLGVFAVLAVGGYLLLPGAGKGKPTALLAKNDLVREARPAREPLPPPPATTPAPPPGTVSADKLAPNQSTPSRQLGTDQDEIAREHPSLPQETAVAKKPSLAAASQLADRKETDGAQFAAADVPSAQPPAATVSGAVEQRFGSGNQPRPPSGAPTVPAAPSSTAAPPATTRAAASDESKTLGRARPEPSGFAYKSLPSIAAANAPSPSPAAADGLLESTAAVRKEAKAIGTTQWFAQAAQGSKQKADQTGNTSLTHPVLASFQVEQAGPDLRIIDGDGSVYSGYVQIAVASRRQRSIKAEPVATAQPSGAYSGVLEEKAAATLDANQAASQTYFFRVIGTNRSLQKKVEFSGNLTSASNLNLALPVKSNGGNTGIGGGAQPALPQPNLQPLVHSRISGKLVIGSGKAVEINALPTSP